MRRAASAASTMRVREARSSSVRAASTSRRRSASSASRRSVMSKIAPSIHSRPPGPLTSWPRSSTQRISPSARTIRYSSTNALSDSWRVLDLLEDGRAVVGVDDAHQRAPRAGDEVGRRVAGDALDLVADQRQRVVRMPGGAVDRARDVDHQRAQQRVVGALLGGAHARSGAGEQLGARERALDVVVGAGLEHRRPRRGCRRGPRRPAATPRPCGRRHAGRGSRRPGRLAADEDQLGGRGGERLQRRLRGGGRPALVAGRAQPGGDLRLDLPDEEERGLVPPQVSGGVGHSDPIIHA